MSHARLSQETHDSAILSFAILWMPMVVTLNDLTFIIVPEGARVGHVFECQVCHRSVQLQEQNDAPFGELVPQPVL
jgi:hypothetical protein